MNKLLLLFALLFGYCISVFAQNLELSFDGDLVPSNGGLYTVYSTDTNVSFSINVGIKNKSTSNLDVKVKKIELSVVSGSENSFCWNQCQPPEVFVSPDPITINAGDSNLTSFTGDYSSNNHSGKTRIMYVFFVAENSTDSAAVIVEYYAGSGVGISQNDANKASIFSMFPNPTSNEVHVKYNINETESCEVNIYNSLGQVVKTINKGELNFGDYTETINISDLSKGIYFVSVKIGDTTSSRKLVIE